MTKNSIFLMLSKTDAQKNFTTLPHLEKKLFFLQGVSNFLFFFRKLKHNFFLNQEAQMKNKIFNFFQDTWKKLFLLNFFILLRIRLWNYFLMVKKFFYQLIPAQKLFLDGVYIFLKITSVLQRNYKNFYLQGVL